MLKFVDGDLLKSDCTVVAHQANCFSTMGAGIARQIKQQFPEAYVADVEYIYKKVDRLGRFSFSPCIGNSEYPRKTVFNLYGQFDMGGAVATNYNALRTALEGMLDYIVKYHTDSLDTIKIGVPYKIGCGIAGGNWAIVEKMLDYVSELYGIPIYVYKFDEPRPVWSGLKTVIYQGKEYLQRPGDPMGPGDPMDREASV